MGIFSIFGWDPYSILILLVILFSTWKPGYRVDRSQRLFIGLLLSNFFLLIVEMTTRGVNGVPGSVYETTAVVSNILLFILNPFPAFIYILYAHNQIWGKTIRIRRYVYIVGAIIIVHTLGVLTTPWTRFFFFFEEGNSFIRGTGFIITAALNFGMFTFIFIYILFNKSKLNRKQLVTLIIFPLIPSVAAVFQSLFYSVNVIWSAMTISLLIAFFNMQNELLHTDYLTGVYNRRQFDDYLKRKIDELREDEGLALLMIDLDDFKKINDNFGHSEGDAALEAASKIICSALRKEDMVARFAGDEFVAVLSVKERADLDKATERIEHALADYNEKKMGPYVLSFISVGSGIYNGEGLKEFLSAVDNNMYENKRKKS